MTLVRRTSPLGELVSLRQAMDRLFEDSFVRPHGWMTGGDSFGFPVDVTSGNDSLTIEASLPGFRPEDVDITVENGTLSINAQSQSERSTGEGENLVTEIRRGAVSRTIALPNGLEADKATASFENGILKLQIPKAEAVKPRQIKISATTDGSTHGTQGTNGSAQLDAGDASTKTTATAGV